MKIPVLRGTIDRRILVNYHVDPEVMARLVPAPMRPQLVQGRAVAGICLIRLKHIRPRFIPWGIGIGSENAAHRIAVEWDQNGATRQGVYIPRRDTSSRLNAWVGGRLFPGEHHHARFRVAESAERLEVELTSDDGQVRVHVLGEVADRLPKGSLFASVAEASAFFEAGSLGYSATSDDLRFDGLELRCQGWQVTPMAVEQVASSYFEDPAHFPPGTIQFDHALLMRGIVHEGHAREDLCCAGAAA